MTGRWLRYLILSVLTLQTSVHVLSVRYTRLSSPQYLASTAIFLTEILKYVLCILLLLHQSKYSVTAALHLFWSEVIKKPEETIKLSVPSCLYTVQNNLLFLALTNLDAATYQVTYQLKILTTAIFSVILLNRKLEPGQWFALVLLMGGVALVQQPSSAHSDQSTLLVAPDQTTGLLAVLIACFLSGFSGVYYEKLIKSSSQPSLIVRNLQLGVFSLLFSLVGMVWTDWAVICISGMFVGYTRLVLLVIVLQAVGGLVVAATIKYADNILKGFATSVSILVSMAGSWIWFNDLDLGPHFVFGASLVIGATVMFGLKSGSQGGKVAQTEKQTIV